MAHSGHASKTTICLWTERQSHESTVRELIQQSGYRMLSCSTLHEFLNESDPRSIDVIVFDHSDGLQLCPDVIPDLRNQSLNIPFFVVTASGNVEMAVRCMQLGALTVLERPLNHTAFLAALESAVRIAADRRNRNARKELIYDRVRRLTSRELEVMKLVLEGKSSKEVAKILGCTAKTVDVHRSRIVYKLEVGSINEVLHDLILAEIVPLPLPTEHQPDPNKPPKSDT